MELKDFVLMQFDKEKHTMEKTLDTLTYQEISWRPCSGANPIGLILLHCARNEDLNIQSRWHKLPEIWATGKWYQRLNLPVEEIGSHLTVDQVNSFKVPELKDIMAYTDAVREKSLEIFKNLKPEELDMRVTMPYGEFGIAELYVRILAHILRHIGEIDYLRGLQRGMDK